MVPAIHDLFTRHQLEWMARSVGSYNKELEQEFYASYVANLRASFDRRSNMSNRHHLPIFESVAIGWTSLYPPFTVFFYGADTDATRVPSPPSLTIGGM